MISGMLRHESPRADAGDAAAAAPSASVPWLARRLFPLLATVGLVAIGMAATTWWGPALVGKPAWMLPHDLWGTLIAAHRLARLNLAGLYTQPTGLITFPGAAVILFPVVAISDAAGLSLQVPGPLNADPGVWLLAGPYQIAISAVVLFAADALAERLGVTRPKRALLVIASAVALWTVSVQWGHPEDAVAVGLLLYAILALSRARTARSGWLTGAAIAVQPLVLLAVPFVVMATGRKRLAGFLARAAAPATLLLAAAAAANWSATFTAVTSQPNWPAVDHPSPWVFLAPDSGNGTVAAGPARALAILIACGCALIVGRRWRAAAETGDWDPPALAELLWWAALALALRPALETVMVSYYLWPVPAVALITASRGWWRLIAVFIPAATLTAVSQLPWPGLWTWWLPMIAGLLITLVFSRWPVAHQRNVPETLVRKFSV